MKRLQPLVNESAAWARLHRPPFFRLRRLWRRVRGNGSDTPRFEKGQVPYLEPLCLPTFLVSFEKPTNGKGAARALASLVDGHGATCSICDLDTIRWDESSAFNVAAESFEPGLSATEAEAIARQQLRLLLLRRPGWRRKVETPDPRCSDLVEYPYWVYYYERRRGLLDVKILDAVTGEVTGPKIKASLLDALASAEK